MQSVVETNAYLSAAKDAGMSESELKTVVDILAADPTSGEVMVGTGGCRKLRIAGRGKGKSGGYRVVTVFGGMDVPVFLLTVFGKDEKDNLSKAERNELAQYVQHLFVAYQAGVADIAKKRRRRL
ncbi:type II toxin-antitoxin system RelE/ParE family toxin [Amaricoccus sp.]|uniref:type II toxin-antitoxin system RelE/ParE family toxin n=1 Tax=Amaricoccus sp. TaxID=1872485 RepID=UPI001B41A11E|nr:type II toxin-antitoxin system RelE/ParE family toxin [Amaricoccus sp.]MBP7003166.1 type II toxin-antitoxin system RelE/ParE family toxin [Amaricoccus sp.]